MSPTKHLETSHAVVKRVKPKEDKGFVSKREETKCVCCVLCLWLECKEITRYFKLQKDFDEEEHHDNNNYVCILIIYNGNYMFMVGSLVRDRV